MTANVQSGAHKRRHRDDDDKEKPIIAKTPTDLQRLRLEKLMKHPEKPVPIPERPKEKSTPHVPDFVRNVMGSSAGAGSGEFHVYRHLRRKEYARQKFIQEKAEKELHDEEYHQKLEENKKLAEQRTAKKRQKRLKKKQRQKEKNLSKPAENTLKKEDASASEESDEDQCPNKIKRVKCSTESHTNEADECNTDFKCAENKEERDDEIADADKQLS